MFPLALCTFNLPCVWLLLHCIEHVIVVQEFGEGHVALCFICSAVHVVAMRITCTVFVRLLVFLWLLLLLEVSWFVVGGCG